jgi:hypothetical protein
MVNVLLTLASVRMPQNLRVNHVILFHSPAIPREMEKREVVKREEK